MCYFLCTVLTFVCLIMHVFYFCYVFLYNYDFMYVYLCADLLCLSTVLFLRYQVG